MELSGKAALVTGSAVGVGRATALELAKPWARRFVGLGELPAMSWLAVPSLGPAGLSSWWHGASARMERSFGHVPRTTRSSSSYHTGGGSGFSSGGFSGGGFSGGGFGGGGGGAW